MLIDSTVLLNIGTTPRFRKHGAASALVRWICDRADRDGVMVYLDTQEDPKVQAMHERLGFEVVGAIAMDLRQYGGSSVYSHIAMARTPRVPKPKGRRGSRASIASKGSAASF